MRLRLARKLELRMLKAAVHYRWAPLLSDPEARRAALAMMLIDARVRRQTHRRAFRRVWQAETRS